MAVGGRRAAMAKSGSAGASERLRRWRELMRRWRASGLSQAEFCRRRGIPIWQFAWWKRRLVQDEAAGSRRRPARGTGRFVQVHVAPVVSGLGQMELALDNGRVLRFGVDVDAARLAEIVAALEARCRGGQAC